MQKNQYKKYRQLLKIRDRAIVAVLVFVGIFYCLSLSGDGESEVLMYRAEAVERAETSEWEEGNPEASGAAAKTAAPETIVTAAAIEIADETATAAADNTEAAQAETDGSPAETAAGATDDRINLNTASLEELDSLPGIGPATAKLILEYRQQYGGFAAPEEIKNVKRIGDKTYEKLKDHIRV